jgi:phenylacetate-CoA ligase
MRKPQGRTDDMLIIRGVNVFPSQIEAALLSFDSRATNYLLVVDRVNNLDTLEVQIETPPDIVGSIADLQNYQKKAKSVIDSAIGVGVTIKLKEPKSLERSMGKAVRVVDNRKIKNKFEG